MKVQIIIPDTIKKPMGGMGVQCKHIMKSMAGFGVEFDVIGGTDGTDNERCIEENYEFSPLEEIESLSGKQHPLGRNLMLQLPLFATAINRPRPDLVHAFDWTTFQCGIYLSKHWGVPLVATMQLSVQKLQEDSVIFEDQPLLYGLNASLEFMGMQHADAIVQVSNNYASRFPSIFDNKTFVVENGIDLQEWKNFNKIELPGKGKIKLVYIGRFDWMKNTSALVAADIPEEVDLIFVGGRRGGIDMLYEEAEEVCKQRSNFHFLGPKYGQEKIDILCSADAQIVPSTHEPFGIVALEALAACNILLSSFKGGMGDFLNKDVAIDCGTSPESISNAVKRLLDMKDDEKAIRRARGMMLCGQYSWDTQAKKLHNVYRHVLGK